MSTALNPAQNNRLESAMNGAGKKAAPVDHPTITRILAKSAEFGKALPKVMTPDRFMRIAIGALRRNPKLLECDPLSIMGSLLIAAQLGLEVNTPLGHFYLIPRWNNKTGRLEADGQVGYKGWVDLLNRTGNVKDLIAHTVYERDEFDYSLGDNEHITHKPAMGDRGEAIAYYVIVKLTNGGVRRRVLSRHDVEQYRRRSKTPNAGPWVSDYNAMALKTTFLRELPWLPLSLELREAASYENAIEAHAKVVYSERANQIEYDMPEPAAQLEYAPAEQVEEYQQQYQEPEPAPAPPPPRQTRRAAPRAAAPAPAPLTADDEITDVEPGPAKPSAPAKPLSEANPQHVKAFETWLATMEKDAHSRGLEHLTMPGSMARVIYADLVENGVAPQCADTYPQKRLNVAKLRADWNDTLHLLDSAYARVLAKFEADKQPSAEPPEAPWEGKSGEAYHGDY